MAKLIGRTPAGELVTATEHAAAIYSPIGTAKLSGVDPEAWLRHVLAHIADRPVNWIDE